MQRTKHITSRKNPYPDYMDCEEAFLDLYNEVVNPNIEAHKRRLLKVIDLVYSTDDDLKAILKSLVQGISAPNDFKKVYDLLITQDHFYLANNFPAYAMMSNIEVIENIKFVHFFPTSRLESIKKHGLYGRATPSLMTLTREVSDFYIKDNGFIFAYEFAPDLCTVVSYPNRIEGIAKKALKFYFEPDTEEQIIVPLKCIESYTIHSKPRNAFVKDFDSTPDPTKCRLGSLTECGRCGRKFKLKADSIYLGVQRLCPQCRKKTV